MINRVSFNCEVSDGTGTLSITTFNEDAEKLFKMTTTDIFKMVHSDDHECFASVAQRLSGNKFLIEVGPKLTLYQNKALQWGLRKLVTEEAGNVDRCELENQQGTHINANANASVSVSANKIGQRNTTMEPTKTQSPPIEKENTIAAAMEPQKPDKLKNIELSPETDAKVAIVTEAPLAIIQKQSTEFNQSPPETLKVFHNSYIPNASQMTPATPQKGSTTKHKREEGPKDTAGHSK